MFKVYEFSVASATDRLDTLLKIAAVVHIYIYSY